MSFEKYTEFLTKAFTTLEKDEDERLSNRQKVERLIKGINTGDAKLQASKAVSMCLFLSASLPVAWWCSVGGP